MLGGVGPAWTSMQGLYNEAGVGWNATHDGLSRVCLSEIWEFAVIVRTDTGLTSKPFWQVASASVLSARRSFAFPPSRSRCGRPRTVLQAIRRLAGIRAVRRVLKRLLNLRQPTPPLQARWRMPPSLSIRRLNQPPNNRSSRSRSNRNSQWPNSLHRNNRSNRSHNNRHHSSLFRNSLYRNSLYRNSLCRNSRSMHRPKPRFNNRPPLSRNHRSHRHPHSLSRRRRCRIRFPRLRMRSGTCDRRRAASSGQRKATSCENG